MQFLECIIPFMSHVFPMQFLPEILCLSPFCTWRTFVTFKTWFAVDLHLHGTFSVTQPQPEWGHLPQTQPLALGTEPLPACKLTHSRDFVSHLNSTSNRTCSQ